MHSASSSVTRPSRLSRCCARLSLRSLSSRTLCHSSFALVTSALRTSRVSSRGYVHVNSSRHGFQVSYRCPAVQPHTCFKSSIPPINGILGPTMLQSCCCGGLAAVSGMANNQACAKSRAHSLFSCISEALITYRARCCFSTGNYSGRMQNAYL